MPFYHVYVRFLQKGTENEDEAIELDFSGKRLMRDIVKPFSDGRSFSVSGCLLDPDNIVQLSINETEHESAIIVKEAYDKQLIEDKYDEEDYVTEQGIDVTRKFIAPRRKEPKPKGSPERKNIFIVHGRDRKPVEELREILIDLNLNPIILHEQPSGGRTILEKLEKYSDVGFAFVILTPEDRGGFYRGKTPVLGGDILEDAHFRARQNVILELGYFIGLLGRDKVCCLYKGNVELPSDIQGIAYIRFDKSVEETRQTIVKELRAAGYSVGAQRTD